MKVCASPGNTISKQNENPCRKSHQSSFTGVKVRLVYVSHSLSPLRDMVRNKDAESIFFCCINICSTIPHFPPSIDKNTMCMHRTMLICHHNQAPCLQRVLTIWKHVHLGVEDICLGVCCPWNRGNGKGRISSG